MLIDENLKYTADIIEESDSVINLKGKARLVNINKKDNLSDDELIETDEIVII
ncbi:MAG: hypothetical protein HC905_19205 [Bacteroidales bacterium]|nr:hypothetical protein [Bacteroidales bacterium]